MPPVVTVIDGTGRPHDIAEADVGAVLRANPEWRVQSEAEGVSRAAGEAEAELYSGAGNALDAAAARAWGAATLGATDAAMGILGGDQAKHRLRKLQEHQQLASAAGEVIGGVTAAATGLGPVGSASTLGARVAKAGEGAGAVARIGRAAAGSGIEGAVQGFGSGISELALSEDPLDVERAFSTLTSRTLYGGAIGAAAGTVAKSAEIGLLKGKAALDDLASRQAAVADVGDDLANLDIKGLQAAERAEREVIETGRVAARKELADELISFRQELKQAKHAVLTKNVDLPAIDGRVSSKELGRIAVKANKQLDNLLDNPVGLAKNPAKALDALQRQENALAKVMERSDELRAAFAADTSGTRMAALETVGPALERNRALQAKIAALGSEATSPRLAQIAEAKEALAAGGRGGRTLAEQMASGTVYNAVSGVVSMLPGGGFLAPMLGAKAADVLTNKVFGRLGAAMSEGQARAAKALSKVFEVGARGAAKAPPVATRVLNAVAFAPERDDDPTPPRGRSLVQAYQKRTQEIRDQIETGPTGKPQVRMAARQKIADRLQPIAAMQPKLADQLETLAVRKLEFLAENMPKRPEIGGIPIGPDRWQPGELEMRAWARLVAAAEDPDGVLERVADGMVTPEDAKVMRELYPEQLQAFTFGVLGQLPTLRKSLPYNRRIALSVLTGVPVDPSMDPRILTALQAQYEVEDAPATPQAQFGSVKNTEVGTPSERREARE